MRVQYQRAIEKVEGWLEGVDADAFSSALEKLVDEKRAAGEYRFKSDEEVVLAKRYAKKFFDEFSRKIVELSDGRCVYFAPDLRARVRNTNNAVSWAEYAFHAVSSSGKILDGKCYRERLFNQTKADDVRFIVPILQSENCMYRVIDAHPENDARDSL